MFEYIYKKHTPHTNTRYHTNKNTHTHACAYTNQRELVKIASCKKIWLLLFKQRTKNTDNQHTENAHAKIHYAYTRARSRMHARTHAHKHACTHEHTQTRTNITYTHIHITCSYLSVAADIIDLTNVPVVQNRIKRTRHILNVDERALVRAVAVNGAVADQISTCSTTHLCMYLIDGIFHVERDICMCENVYVV